MGSGNKRTKVLLKAGEAEHAGPHTGSLQQPENSQLEPDRERIRHLCPLLSLPLTPAGLLIPTFGDSGKVYHSDLIISTKTTMYGEMHNPPEQTPRFQCFSQAGPCVPMPTGNDLTQV